MAVTQRSRTLLFLATFAMAAAATSPTEPTPLTSPTPQNCPEQLFGLHITASRNSTGYDNVKARLDQPEGATWQMDLAAAEHAAPGGGGERRRVTTIALFAEADLREEGDARGTRRRLSEQETKIATLQASNAELKASNAALQRQMDAVLAAIREGNPRIKAAMDRYLQIHTTAPKPTTIDSAALPTAVKPAPSPSAKCPYSMHTNKKLAAVSEQLAHAAHNSNFELMKQLVAQGVNVWHRECWEYPALHWAAERGLVDGIRLLLEIGTPIDMFNNIRQTALQRAAYAGKTESVEALIAAGANLDLQERNGFTALHHAAHYNKPAVARLLMAAGADPNIKDHEGKTPHDYTSNVDILVSLSCK